ncbi:MAG: peptidase domain-containing ABC transporter [Bacteroidales bacterium]
MKSFPYHRQFDSMQCGIACLQMICEHFGKKYSPDTVAQYCYATTEGVSMLGIIEAANLLGLRSTCGKVTLEQLNTAKLPCILHWTQNHFIVLYKVKIRKNRGNIYYVADPAKGLLEYCEKEFCDNWLSTLSMGDEKGIGLFLSTTPAFFEREGDKKERRRSIGFLMGYFKQYRRYFGQIVLGLLLGSLLQLIFPFLTQAIVDIGITHKDLSFIYLILLGQLFLTVSRTSVDFIRSWILLHISIRINISLVSDFFIKLLKLPMDFFDTKLMGDLMQRMNDHNRVEKFLTTQTLNVMFSLLSFIVFAVVLLFYNRLIFWIFIFFTILYGVWVAVFLKKRRQLDYLYFSRQAANNNKTYQFITSMQEIKLQNCEQRRRWEWEDVQADLFEVNIKILKLQQTQQAGSIFINEVKNIIISILAAMAVMHGQMTLGMMLAVQYIIGQLNMPVEQFMMFLYSLQDVKISLERIHEIHRIKNEESGKQALSKFSDNDRTITFENVDFKYDKHCPYKTLDSINLQIPQGKVTAIVGTSGSGKTTLIKLILGYYKTMSGSIKVGNTPLDEYNMKWWRSQCGVVMQDGILFSESIARNIAVDDGEINGCRLPDAVLVANIREYIMGLPLRYDTIIGPDGVGLSQGQKQRILIARAAYKNPQYILLDEATNSLDANNERIIVNNLHEFYRGKTVVIVAHRLSTVRDADQIIVMDKGKIAEIGNHNSLIKKRGHYYTLVKNQLELGD